jgi:hypothetical protein
LAADEEELLVVVVIVVRQLEPVHSLKVAIELFQLDVALSCFWKLYLFKR